MRTTRWGVRAENGRVRGRRLPLGWNWADQPLRSILAVAEHEESANFHVMASVPPPALELARWARDRFGARVVDVRLFGSRARGEADEESDVDVLVVVDELSSAEAREIAFFCGDLLTQTDTLVSPLALSRARFEELRSRERRIIREIDRDGLPL